MIIPGLHNLIGGFPVVGQQDQSLGILVQPSHRIDPGGISDGIDDVIRFLFAGCTYDPFRFIVGQIYGLTADPNRFPLKTDLLAFKNLCPRQSRLTVHRHLALLYIKISLPSGTHACLT